LNKTQIKTQITQAQNRFNQELNQHNKIFAYPYGGFCMTIGLIFLILMGIGKVFTLVLKLTILA
jgi:hypothetical protein